MVRLLDQFSGAPRDPLVKGTEARLSEIAALLENGASLEEAHARWGLGMPDIVAVLARLALGPDGDLGPPLIQDHPPHPKLLDALSEPALARLSPNAPRPVRLALSAGLLQVHDFWDASHHAAQEADDLGESLVSAYWHGIAHRREPDPGNAAYWFRRVGRHPLLGPLGTAAKTFLHTLEGPTHGANRVVRDSQWDLFAFLEFCRAARQNTPAEQIARRLQRLEMALLLETTLDLVLVPANP